MAGRRGFFIVIGAGVLEWVGAARAQSKQRVVIGWLASRSRRASEAEFGAFKEELAAFGWNETTVSIEERWADGYYDRLPALASDLAARKPAIIVTAGGQATTAAAKAAPTIPVVTTGAGDLVHAGLAKSLARPGGMVTGLRNLTLADKFVELLVTAVLKIKRIGILINPSNIDYDSQMKSLRRSPGRASVEARFAEARRPEDIEGAISTVAAQGAQALMVMGSSLFVVERKRIVALALARRWPVIASNREFAEAGALMTYGYDPMINYRRAAHYVDRILKGAKPGDLPIEEPTKIELVINMRTAASIKIEIPRELAVRADRVIE